MINFDGYYIPNNNGELKAVNYNGVTTVLIFKSLEDLKKRYSCSAYCKVVKYKQFYKAIKRAKGQIAIIEDGDFTIL